LQFQYLHEIQKLIDGTIPTEAEETSTRTEHFITARKLLHDGAEAVERLMSAMKEITELAGYTSRVADMVNVFSDMNKGKYSKGPIAENLRLGAEKFRIGAGIIIEDDYIALKDLPIVTPNGDVLVKSISFDVKPGTHLLISGPNGCGKSSLFRIIGGLWPIYGGTLTKPKFKDIFYIPQRPYLSLGTLREQVIYPDTVEDMHRKTLTDVNLFEIMEWVNLKNIVERDPQGFNTLSDWADILSGGEKQRIGIARLLYHKPKYAFLDECTSQVSIDVEGQMYLKAKELGITLLTVTHRPSLWKFHNHLLQFNGEGGWEFSALNSDTRLSLKEEKTKIENELVGVPVKQRRLKELNILLAEDSSVPVV